MVFFTDLDNTLIYSYKHDIGEKKRNVELYQGREISFMTEESLSLLARVREIMEVVPLSTRTREQYERIDMGLGAFKTALVSNGGVLLKNGESDEEWYRESVELVKESNEEIAKGIAYLDKDKRRTFELRYIEKLFVFTKCDEPQNVVSDLKKILDETLVDVFNNGIKVYVVPKNLNKGAALKRLMKRFPGESSIAAGDSEFDISMLSAADIALAPYGFKEKYGIDLKCEEMPEKRVFSESLLTEILKRSE